MTPADRQRSTDDRRRILVLEDDRPIAEVLRTYFTARGYVAAIAPSARDALHAAALTVEPPDVIILDYSLPDTSGATVAQWMRSQLGAHPALIAYSAADDPAVRTEMLAAGCDHYVAKPARLSDLLETIEDLLAERSRGRSPDA